MKYYLIAGERSGDLHGGNLIKQIKRRDTKSSFIGFGGNEMSANGMVLSEHYSKMAFMGFLEVMKNLGTIRGLIQKCKQDILNQKPDVVVLIDYGGFNMKIARFCKKNGFRTFYYISPKVWAWNTKRALKLKATVDRMFVILPFEMDFFRKYGWKVDYVGNPVLDAVKSYAVNPMETGEFVALLPGSRPQELKHGLPILTELALKVPEVTFRVAAVDNVDATVYDVIRSASNVVLDFGHTYDLLAHARAAVVTSGTATLEAALWKVPQVVIYETSQISYLIARNLIKVDYISLVNLIVGKPVVKELIQKEFNVQNIASELDLLLNNDEYRNDMLSRYDDLYKTLDIGSASENTADLMLKYLKAG